MLKRGRSEETRRNKRRVKEGKKREIKEGSLGYMIKGRMRN